MPRSRSRAQLAARASSRGPAPETLNGSESLPDAFRAAAARLFRERGYARVTIEDIVQEVGVTKGAFYHYFDSKATLLFELHDDYVEYSVKRIRDVVEAETDPAKQLRAYIREVFFQIHEHGEYVQVLFDERRELPPRKTNIIERKKDLARTMLQNVIERGAEMGTFGATDARLTALAVSGMAIWGYQWYQASGRVSHEKIADAFADLVLQGLEKDGASP